MIDIVVPVYNAPDDLQQCLDSVRRCTASGTYRVVVIDDGSPDPRIGELLRQLAQRAEWPELMVLSNPSNLGFVRTVNRGMAQSADRDVVLLNSDTIVTPSWLERIARAAAADPGIATITPFSNNAEICSFPRFCVDNKLAGLPPIDLIAQACGIGAAGVTVEVPTGVGFCMYIRRAALHALGDFDAETFGLGYGEENDFCMRAAKAGWRNVLLADTFVAHTGGRSFDERKRALMDGAMARLVSKHPDYPERVQRFIAQDPVRPSRSLVAAALDRLLRPEMPTVLHVMHAREGGTIAHVHDLMRGASDRARHVRLVVDHDVWRVEQDLEETVAFELRRQPDEPWADLLNAVCAAFGADLVHFHHLSGARDGLLLAARGLSVPYGVTLHDEHLACPTITLIDQTGEYCGAEVDPAVCGRCLAAQAPFRGIDIVAWREEHHRFLQAAAFVLAPSRFVASIASTYFPGVAVDVVPHGIDVERYGPDARVAGAAGPRAPTGDDRPVVALIGAIGPVKGARRLEALVERTRTRRLPLRWVVIGYTDVQFQPMRSADGVYTVHGAYEPAELPALVSRYGVELVVFPSQGPESFSYALSEAWLLGQAVLVPGFGALGERTQAAGAGWIMRDSRDPDAIIDQILDLLAPSNRAELVRRRDLAARWRPDSLTVMAERTLASYARVLADPSAGGAGRSQDRWIAGLATLRPRLVAGARPPEAKAPAVDRAPGLVDTALESVGHLALRLRHTAAGRWLYRVTPVRWQQRVKARLLARRAAR